MKTERFQFVNNKKFNPKSLFRNGEQGVWYDPSDISMYMSNLGPELVTNGDFSNSTTSWSVPAGWSVSGGQVNALTTNASLTSLSSVQMGKTYRVQFSITTYTSGTLYVRIGQGAAQTFTSSGVKVVYLTSVSTTGVEFYGGAISCSIDDISVCEVLNISTATMFQDSAGTIPVTGAEQPVGLMLDKSRGAIRGPELLANGDFSSGETGWSIPAGWLLTGSTCTATATSSSLRQLANPYIAGKFYEVTFDWTHTSGLLFVRVGLGTAVTFNTSGRKRVILGANAPNGIEFYGGSVSGVVDNISVKEVYGNHSYQTTATSRPILSARYNLFKKTEQFNDTTLWSAVSNITVTANAGIAPDGTNTANLIAETTATTVSHYIGQNINFTAGLNYKISVAFKKGSGATAPDWVQLTLPSGAFGGVQYANFNISTGVIGVNTGGTANIINLGNGWYRCEWTATATTGGIFGAIGVVFTNNSNGLGRVPNYTGNTTSDVFIWGADLRLTDDTTGMPTYQKVNHSTDYDTVGFPFYLSTDGIDDGMQSNAINFSSTNKLTLVTGLRVNSTSGMQMPFEFSASYASTLGSFELSLNEVVAGTFAFATKRTSANHYKYGGVAQGIRTLVFAGNIDGSIAPAATSITYRENGTNPTVVAIGNETLSAFGNYPLFLFRRGGTSLPFNGRFYGIVLVGKKLNSSDFAKLERYINNKTKGYV